MTRIDMTTREWHELVKPVLPHAVNIADFPELYTVRIEPADRALYAAASDRCTLAVERYPVPHGDAETPVHLDAGEVKATLKMFRHTKDVDPALTVTIDEAVFPVRVAGFERTLTGRAVTLQAEDGTRAVMRDRRAPDRDHLASWRKLLAKAIARDNSTRLDGLDLHAGQLGRWAAAAHAGERLSMYTGPKPGDPILVTVEQHFAGLWMMQQYLESPAKTAAELPWLGEIGIDTETGEKLFGDD